MLLTLLIVPFIACFGLLLSYNTCKRQAADFRGLYETAQGQLREVYNALDDVNSGAVKELGPAILHYKQQCLQEQNKLCAIQSLLNETDATTSETACLLDQIAHILQGADSTYHRKVEVAAAVGA